MKKKLLSIILWLSIIFAIIILLNIGVTTHQGVNFRVHAMRVPLYLKVLDFFDRHFNYKQLVNDIIKDSKSDEERAMKIFAWTYKNIRPNPKELPVIDDHVWHIIIRGYGADDQSCDVLTTLCNYAGIDSFFTWVYSGDQQRISLSFVRLNQKWTVFDSYRGVYFKNEKGGLADIGEIGSGKYQVSKSNDIEMDYTNFLNNLPSVKAMGMSRSNIQSPLRRLFYQVCVKLLKRNKN